jgi:adenylate cyclase
VLQWLKRREVVHSIIVLFFVLPVLGLIVSGWDRYSWTLSFAKLKFESLENYTVDHRNIYYRRAATNPEVVFLTIDTASVYVDAPDQQTIASSRPLSLMLAGGFPYPREVYADVCDRLFGAGAKAVALDINFQKPSPTDSVFHDALEKYRDHVVIGMNFSDNFEQGRSSTLSLPPETLLPDQDPFDNNLGFLNFWPDPDGVIRNSQYRTNEEHVNLKVGSEKLPKLYSLAARAVQKGGHGDIVPDDLNLRMMRFANLTRFPTYSLYEIFEPHIWATTFQNGTFFKDKIVLVGPKGDWAKDQLVTPFGQMNGAEVHLNAINALLQNEFLYPAPNGLIIATVLGSGLIALLLALTIAGIAWRFLAAVAVVTGYTWALIWAYNGPGWLLPAVAPMGVFCGAMGVGFIYDFVLTQIEKLRLRTTFERYHSKNVVKYLLEHTTSYKEMLAGTRRPVTVLFSDIRSFTAIVETTADSHQLVGKLNEYFTAMVDCVFRYDGSLDKFMGDGIMAVWGNTPHNFGPKEDAVRAVQAALAMIAELRRLNAKWVAEGKTEWQIGIGLNHGQVIVGDMGSQQHKEFGIVGDAVNLGSRLEGLTKKYHLQIILGERVAELVLDHFYLRSVDFVQVTGKTMAVQAFTVLAEKTEPLPPEQQKFLSLYEEGISSFRRREFVRAKELFAKALEIQRGDYLAAQYVTSCATFIENPPDASWTGVRVMAEK